jgi:ribose transport system permease protein
MSDTAPNNQPADVGVTASAVSSVVRPTRARFRLPEEIGVIVALLALVAFVGVFKPLFINPKNLISLFGDTAFYGMITLGMVFLLAIREIDLSVGWMFNFSAVIAATLMVSGVDPWIAALGGVAFGALLGLFNGVLSVGLRLPAIIITLGTYSMFRGLALVVNRSRAIIPPDDTGSFFTVTTGKLFGIIPVIAVVFIVLAVLLHLLLHYTRFGYRVQAIGSNPDAARLAGIPLGRVRIQTLVLMGAICGLSGSLFVGFRGAIDPSSGQDFALTVVAAAIIGGTPLSGGWGTILGGLIGVQIIAVISSGIIFFGIDATWSTFVTGTVIVLAVVLDQVVRRQRTRRALRTRETL